MRQADASEAAALSAEIKILALKAGLGVASITSAAPFPGLADLLDARTADGHLAGMEWFTAERSQISANPLALHVGARSIVSVGIPYYRDDIGPPDDGVKRGRIARYAWGVDYHKTLKQRMSDMVSSFISVVGRPVEVRLLADTARIVDRAVAQRAGLGWYGKHTNIIVPGHGSFVMLGEILIDVPLEPDMPLDRNCGSCRICLDRCPTGAIVEPYVVHAPLCISYQTIENRAAIPRNIRSKMGNWVFGCDVCQDVCPYTGAARAAYDEAFAPSRVENAFPSLHWLLAMTEAEYRLTYRGTAVLRAKRAGLARNAAIALGNSGDESDLKVLTSALMEHDEPLVRGHAAWAIGQIGGKTARDSLDRALASEANQGVRGECQVAREKAH